MPRSGSSHSRRASTGTARRLLLGPPAAVSWAAFDHEYEVGGLEVTVAQYVAFLNTVDPRGLNRHDLYVRNMSPSRWPKYGQITRSANAAESKHYAVAYPEWANKPRRLHRLSACRTFRQFPDQRRDALRDQILRRRG